MRSWDREQPAIAKPRTLAIYIDLIVRRFPTCNLTNIPILNMCSFLSFCDAITEEISRNWPAVNLQARIFDSCPIRRSKEGQ